MQKNEIQGERIDFPPRTVLEGRKFPSGVGHQEAVLLMLLLCSCSSPLLLPDSGIGGPEKKVGEAPRVGFPVLLLLFPHQAPSRRPQAGSVLRCWVKLSGSLWNISRHPSHLWHFCLPRVPKGGEIVIPFLFLGSPKFFLHSEDPLGHLVLFLYVSLHFFFLGIPTARRGTWARE